VWVGPEDHKAVGECLARTRKAMKVSQDELADRLRKPQSFVSAYERGQRRVDLMEFFVIVAAIGGDANKVFAEISGSAAAVVKRTLGATRSRSALVTAIRTK